MLTCGRVLSAIACFVLMLTIIGWLPAAIWAGFIVSNHHAERRHERLLRSMRRG